MWGLGGTMQLVERFHAEANDGRIVEILKWASRSVIHGDGGVRGQVHTIYATVQGWLCRPSPDGSYTVIPSGMNVRRIG